ncbi:hypothetical protein J6590_003889 [Homalodisca vitripennis]|nr:hypothetical protein J6590_003889 [Homalodisca vitripennis]
MFDVAQLHSLLGRRRPARVWGVATVFLLPGDNVQFNIAGDRILCIQFTIFMDESTQCRVNAPFVDVLKLLELTEAELRNQIRLPAPYFSPMYSSRFVFYKVQR